MSEERQIQSMIDFIEREAAEKAEELNYMGQEEYDTEKMRLVEAAKANVRADAEKKKKNVEVQQRVNRANHTKGQRVRVMESRAVLLEELKTKTKQKMVALVNNQNKYKQLMGDLLKQSAKSIKGDSQVFTRKADANMVKGLLKETEQWYSNNCGGRISLSMSSESLDDDEAWGGVCLKTTDGKITCNNTLAYRSESIFKEQLPSVRYALFNPEGGVIPQ
eukprot:253645_1